MKKPYIALIIIILIIILFVIILIRGSLADNKARNNINIQRSNTCFIQDCHPTSNTPTCNTEPLICDLTGSKTDVCAGYITCNNNCKIIKEELYDKCVDCFSSRKYSLKCLIKFPQYWKNFFIHL